MAPFRVLAISSAALLVFAACGSDDPDTSSSATSTTTAATTGSGGSGGSTTSAGGATASSSSSASSSASSSSSASGTGGAGGSMICDPIAGEDACVACAKGACCSELEACELDVTCSCVIDCIGDPATTDPQSCLGTCGITGFPTGPSLTLLLCANNGCSSECPLGI